MSIYLDSDNEILQWYFDITKKNAIDKNKKAHFIDMYLDVVVSPEGKIVVLDEDELDEALTEGVIS